MRGREVWAYFLAFVVALATVGLFLRYHIARSYQAEMAYWQARLSSVAGDRTQRLADWLHERQADVELLSTRPSVRAALQAHYALGHSRDAGSASQPNVTAILDEMTRLYPYNGVYILDRNAEVVARSSGSAPLDAKLAAICRAEAHASALRIDLLGDVPQKTLISFSSPIFPAATEAQPGQFPRQPLGVALVTADAEQTIFPLVAQESVPTRSGETVLLRRDGKDVVFFSPLRFVPAGRRELRFPFSAAPLPARTALQGHAAFMSAPDYRGVEVLAATDRIPLTGWGLVRKIDRAEALEDFYRMAGAEGAVGALLIFFLAGLLVFHRRHVLSRVVEQEEERFRALLELAPDAIYIFDSSSLRILGRNRKAAEMDGYSEEEMVFLTAADLHPPEESSRHLKEFQTAPGAVPATRTHTLHHRRKNGEVLPVEESQTLVKVGGEKLILSIVRDITERRRAEEALRTSEAGLAEAQQIAHLGNWDWDIVNDRAWWSDEMYRIFGISSSHQTPDLEVSLKCMHPEDRDLVQAALKDALEGRKPYNLDYRVVRPDGSERLVHAEGHVVCNEAGKPLRMVGIVQDITERRREEEARAYLASIVESSDDAIIGKSLEGTILSWNPGAEKVYGYRAEEVVGRSMSVLVPPDHPEELHSILERIARVEHVEHYETVRVRKDGLQIHVAVTISPLKDIQGRVVGASAISRDITERKKAEEEIRRLNEELEARVAQRTAQLEASNKELEAFTYSVSHDLRAPLRHVDGFSKLLVEEHQAALPRDAQEYISIIRESVQQMGLLIDDLLNLARVGRKPLDVQVAGLNSLVEEVVKELQRANPERAIEWKIQTLPFVECDPALMKQVFANLLSNAVKFTRPRNPAVIEVGAGCEDGYPDVFVRDNGVGFSMKYAGRLFGVFQRLHRVEDFEGTGVGLATVQRIIHKHGGRVWAEAELDKGATFHFTLGGAA